MSIDALRGAEDTQPPPQSPTPLWARPPTRLAVLLTVLAVVSWYGVPRIVHQAAGAPHPQQCIASVISEPRSHRLDQSFVIDDADDTGTWARADPCDGTWYTRQRFPPKGGRWYPNGSRVDVDCARTGASYAMTFDGRPGVWATWLHIRGGKWFPSIVSWQPPRDAFAGLPAC
jgi:hypothetical protein